MKITDLKIGDKIVYHIDNISHKGKIVNITKNKIGLTSINYEEITYIPFWIRKDQVISKLEELPPQYKEISVTHENEGLIVSISKELIHNIPYEPIEYEYFIKFTSHYKLSLDSKYKLFKV